jgi:hypothetical protein
VSIKRGREGGDLRDSGVWTLFEFEEENPC